jgi:TIGR03009 family protein
MHYRWCFSIMLLGAGMAALAGQPAPPAPPALDPAKNPIDAILVRWEQAMGGITSLTTEVTRISEDKVFQTTDTYSGGAKYLKPNKAMLWLVHTKKPQDFEQLICNGPIVYKWEPSRKEIHIHQLPPAKQGKVGDDNFVSMLFGMKAVDAKKRYELTLLPPPPNSPPFHYILVVPRDPGDKAEFTRARLVLTPDSYLPRQIWFELPNGNTTTWDFTKLTTNVPLEAREFGEPKPPPGWQLKRVAPAPPPPVK